MLQLALTCTMLERSSAAEIAVTLVFTQILGTEPGHCHPMSKEQRKYASSEWFLKDALARVLQF